MNSLERVGMDIQPLSAIANWLSKIDGSNIHSIVVVRSGALIFEQYMKGADERWRKPLPGVEHGPDVKHDLRSVTKCVVGLLVGKAIETGLLPSLAQPIFDFFPEYADLRTPEKDRILVRHLLTMSAGLEWDENVPATDPNHGELRMWASSDRLRTALEPRMAAEPGSVWNYSGGCTELLGAIIQRAAGKPIDEFAREVLLEPLSIDDVEWGRHGDGRPSASGGLRMCSQDLAKIGQLVAEGGQWKGQQLMPKTWIIESLTPQIGADDRLFYYGYHWWLGRSMIQKRELTWAAGIGLGGQRLFVIRELEVAVVITAGHYLDGMQAWLPLTILNRYVLPSVMS
jgi:CubicO group peptidase (beta-lactamase class C family)